jgi:putative NADH-flavin reductase
MKVLVLGASGRLGRALLTRALAADCTVTAYTRHPAPLLTGDPDIRIFGGSVHDARAVDRAMRDQEAVVWAVANRPTADRSPVPLLYGTRVVIRAMTHAGTARLIYVSDTALHEHAAQGAGGFFRSVLGHGVRRDAREREAAVRESPLDWTIVRPARLTAGPHTGSYAAVLEAPVRASPISRLDAAAFITSQLVDQTFVRQAPHLLSRTTPASIVSTRALAERRDSRLV